jgi:hypothetical protein
MKRSRDLVLVLGAPLLVFGATLTAAGSHGEVSDRSPVAQAPPLREIYLKYPIEQLEYGFAEGMGSKHQEMPQIQFSSEQVSAILNYLSSITGVDPSARTRPCSFGDATTLETGVPSGSDQKLSGFVELNVMAKDKATQSRQVAPHYSDPFGTLIRNGSPLRQLHGRATHIRKYVGARRNPRIRPYA